MSSSFDSLPTEVLTREAEAALAKKIQAHARESDINKLVLANIREAVVYGRAVSGGKIHDDELISLLYEALTKNAKRFDPKFGTRFLAFAKAGIRGALARSWKTKDIVRNGAIEARCEEDEGQLTDDEIVEPDFDTIFTNDRWKLVEKIIQSHCNEQEKTVLTLTYRSGFNFQEIGNLLGVTRSAIHSTHQRALKKVRCELLRQKQLFQ